MSNKKEANVLTSSEHAAFESWYQNTYKKSKPPRRKDDGYFYPYIDDMWIGWQARAKQNVSYF